MNKRVSVTEKELENINAKAEIDEILEFIDEVISIEWEVDESFSTYTE